MAEAQIIRDILQAFANHGFCVVDHNGLDPFRAPSGRGMVWRSNTGALKSGSRFIRFGVPGLPDICGVLQGGQALFCEVKTPQGRMRRSQVVWRHWATSLGALCWEVRSYDEVVKEIQTILK